MRAQYTKDTCSQNTITTEHRQRKVGIRIKFYIIAIFQSALLNNSTHKRAIEEGVVHANSIMFPYLAAF